MNNQHNGDHSGHDQKMYFKLALMALLSFISMYVLMYAMVNKFEDIYPNYNQLYMAGLMAAPMVLIEIILMKTMYKNKKLNAVIAIASIVIGISFFLSIRGQAAISDTQFLKSMIPHHSGAILMCREANIKDPEIQALCQTITESQQQEIDQMQAMLNRMN